MLMANAVNTPPTTTAAKNARSKVPVGLTGKDVGRAQGAELVSLTLLPLRLAHQNVSL